MTQPPPTEPVVQAFFRARERASVAGEIEARLLYLSIRYLKFDGMRPREVAAMLRVPVSTVRRAWARKNRLPGRPAIWGTPAAWLAALADVWRHSPEHPEARFSTPEWDDDGHMRSIRHPVQTVRISSPLQSPEEQ